MVVLRSFTWRHGDSRPCFHQSAVRPIGLVPLIGLLFLFSGGCYVAHVPPSQAARKLVRNRAQVEPTGLSAVEALANLKVSGAMPDGWKALPLQKSLLYSHLQWRSPTNRTATGVAHVRLPLPLSSKSVVGFAAREYAKKAADGQVLRQWADAMGREWFEARNDKYHVTGYVLARGFEAWINYCGYRRQEPLEERELGLAQKALETLLPLRIAPPAETPAQAPRQTLGSAQ